MSINAKEIITMSYVDLMAFIGETNRPPGGKNSIRELVINTFVNSESSVLDVGCNTGYCTFDSGRLEIENRWKKWKSFVGINNIT